MRTTFPTGAGASEACAESRGLCDRLHARAIGARGAGRELKAWRWGSVRSVCMLTPNTATGADPRPYGVVASEHRGCVNALAFSSCGQWLASGCDDGFVRLFDSAREFSCVAASWRGHRSNVFGTAFVPHSSGSLVVSCGNDGDVRVADVAAGASTVYAHHTRKAMAVRVPFGQPALVLSCSADGTVRLVDRRARYRDVTASQRLGLDETSLTARQLPQAFGGGLSSRLGETPDARRESLVLNFARVRIPSVQVNSLAVFGLDVHPLASHMFVTASADGLLRVFDLRRTSADESPDASAVSAFCPLGTHAHARLRDCTGCAFSYDGAAVVGTWLDRAIYTFDTSGANAGGADPCAQLAQTRRPWSASSSAGGDRTNKRARALEHGLPSSGYCDPARDADVDGADVQGRDGAASTASQSEAEAEAEATAERHRPRHGHGERESERYDDGGGEFDVDGEGYGDDKGDGEAAVVGFDDDERLGDSYGDDEDDGEGNDEGDGESEGSSGDSLADLNSIERAAALRYVFSFSSGAGEADDQGSESGSSEADAGQRGDWKPSSYTMEFRGARSSRTIKGVAFYGPRSEFVAAGSDSGRVCFWKRATGKLVAAPLGHLDAVNVVCPHPFEPLVATSGIDPFFALWRE